LIQYFSQKLQLLTDLPLENTSSPEKKYQATPSTGPPTYHKIYL